LLTDFLTARGLGHWELNHFQLYRRYPSDYCRFVGQNGSCPISFPFDTAVGFGGLSIWFVELVCAETPAAAAAAVSTSGNVYEGKTGWIIRNIGGGPAMNVIVAQKKPRGEWFNPVRQPPLAKDSEFLPVWLGHVNTTGLGATYSDYEDRPSEPTSRAECGCHQGN
jgi:hypothetical protein